MFLYSVFKLNHCKFEANMLQPRRPQERLYRGQVLDERTSYCKLNTLNDYFIYTSSTISFLFGQNSVHFRYDVFKMSTLTLTASLNFSDFSTRMKLLSLVSLSSWTNYKSIIRFQYLYMMLSLIISFPARDKLASMKLVFRRRQLRDL